MNIIKASELNTGYTRQDVIEHMCAKVMGQIQRASTQGYRQTNFHGGCWRWDKEKQKIVYPYECDGPYFDWDNYKDEVKQVFIANGYKIKPTGYIGGVWQHTETIMW